MFRSKTQWKVAPDRILLHPFRRLFWLGGLLALVFTVILIAFVMQAHETSTGNIGLSIVMLIVLVPFIGGGFTYVEFDRPTNRMKKMLFGIIPTVNAPFETLYGVDLIKRINGGFYYRISYLADKYGKGVTLSAGYFRETDPNAEAFRAEVIPAIHKFLDAAAPLPQQQIIITDYKYFTWSDGIYALKMKRVGPFIFGLAMLALGIHEATPAAWIPDLQPIGKICMVVLPLFFGVVLISAAFTRITFNTHTRLVERTTPIRLGSSRHHFNDLIDFQTVRRTNRGIYNGTVVNMLFRDANTGKTKTVAVYTVWNTKRIERLIQEIRSIMQ